MQMTPKIKIFGSITLNSMFITPKTSSNHHLTNKNRMITSIILLKGLIITINTATGILIQNIINMVNKTLTKIITISHLHKTNLKWKKLKIHLKNKFIFKKVRAVLPRLALHHQVPIIPKGDLGLTQNLNKQFKISLN